MRSTAVTLALAAVAILAATLAAMSVSDGGLDRLLGGRPVPKGERLYSFDPAEVTRIRLAGPGIKARFELRDGQWRAMEPWQDRMDPRFAASLIGFTVNTRVEDAIPRDKADARLVGLETGNISASFEDAAGRQLASYVLGRRTAWFVQPEDDGDPIPTVFLLPLERGRRDHVYACTHDPHPVLRDGMRLLRDHRPFLFHPDALTAVRIRTSEGELRLAREDNARPWRIVKPLEQPTEKDAVRRLVEGLYTLTAVKVSDPADVMPPASLSDNAIEIGIETVGATAETLLRVERPAEPTARTGLATVSDRNAVFELPLRPGAGEVALLELPLTVNDLRDKTLTRLHGPALQAIRIDPAGNQPVVLARVPKGRWQLVGDGISGDAGDVGDADEDTLVELIQTVTEAKVSRFLTDAATDLAPWGFDQPLLTLRFLSFDGETLELRFARGPDGEVNANRTGSPTVVRIDAAMLGRIATRHHQWKARRLWNLSTVDVVGIERRDTGADTVTLSYSFLDESWGAMRNGEKADSALNLNRAEFMLGALEGLRVSRWLGPGDAAAARALLDPPLRLTVLQRTTDPADETGGSRGIQARTLHVAPVSDSPGNQFYYGRVDGDPDYFILDRETVDDLRVDLFEDA